jgi:hypothetical protein
MKLSKNLVLGAFAVAMTAMAGSATAAPVVVATINDQVEVAAYRGLNSYSGYSSSTFANQQRNGRYWGDSIQSNAEPFNTTQIIVTRDNAANTIQFDLKTWFDGSPQGVPNGLAKYADLFFDTATIAPDGFNYAISLGSQTTPAGVYAVNTFATSQDLWKNQTNYIYGGGFQMAPSAPGYNANFFSTSPVRLTSGTLQSQYSVAVSQLAPVNSIYTVRVVISSTSNLNLFNNFDIFWGTADCSNDAIWGQVVTNSVPAPGALLLLSLGLLGIGGFSRKRKAA